MSACSGRTASTDTAAELAAADTSLQPCQAGLARLDPRVDLAVAERSDHVRPPQLQAASSPPTAPSCRRRTARRGRRRSRCAPVRVHPVVASMVLTCPQPRSSGYTATA